MSSMKLLSVRLSQSEIDSLQDLAEELGMPTASYVRLVLRQYATGTERLAITINKAPPKPSTPKLELRDAARKQVIAEWGGAED